ncbi:hypothetical protein [Asticcacaulis solisilvae]|uniref:hypothetical protein n=1 Tax=Asticcacaulis solisilvae TaxID=1217274 RepID=UPI003FD8735D
MDTLDSPLRAPRTPATTFPRMDTVANQIAETTFRLQENIRNMPLTSFAVAVVLGITVGSMMTRASYTFHRH